MTQRFRICQECLDQINRSEERAEDVGSFLVGIGAGGIEVVPPALCQARLVQHTETAAPAVPRPRSLADVTLNELEAALLTLRGLLKLSSGCAPDWDLDGAIRREWLKAREARKLIDPYLDNID
jgi:hypothetical protein